MKSIPVRHIHSIPREPGFLGGFAMRDVRQLLDGKDMVQELHHHDFYYMLVLEEGEGEHAIDFVPYSARRRSLFFMRPGQVHSLVLKAGSKGYLVQFGLDFWVARERVDCRRSEGVQQRLRRAGNVNHYTFEEDGFERVYSLFRQMFREVTDKGEQYEDVVRALLEIVFIELMRVQEGGQVMDKAGLYKQERMNEFLELVERHGIEHKQVSGYAELLHLSTYQLNAIVKGALGKTCMEVINEYLVLESKRYILATSHQVNQIADRLGFEDASYFIRFFQETYGVYA